MPQPKFVPQDGQVDYTNIRYCPVVNSVLCYEDKILVVQRSSHLRLYPDYWNGISGFLDDNKSIEEKALEELNEELGLKQTDVQSITLGHVFSQEASDYNKTWIVFPVKVNVTTDKVKLDWEARSHKWLTLEEAKTLKLMPGFETVLDELFS